MVYPTSSVNAASQISTNPVQPVVPIANRLNSSAAAVEIPVDTATESYTQRLQAQIERLENKYDNQQSIPIPVTPPPAAVPVVRNAEWDNDSVRRLNNFPSPTPRNNRNNFSNNVPQEQIVGVAPINVEEYNNSLRIPVGQTVSPELPALSNPEDYLPDITPVFDGYIWPSRGVLTSGYGMRWGRMHRGIDIAGPVGTPIVASAPGEVITAGWNSGGYGNLVKVRHADGSVTLYAHNSRILVRRGQQVQQGQLIAEMGSTGFSTGPHLHFEIHPDGKRAVNPMAFLPRKRS